MIYALVDGVKSLANDSGEGGFCIGCGSPVVGKCGSIKINHWAHKVGDDCVASYDSMSQWHIDSQNMFPIENQEVYVDGGSNRADVFSPSGYVIEFQNSPISFDNIVSREVAYSSDAGFSKNGLIWVFNGEDFWDRFDLRKAAKGHSFRWYYPKRSFAGINNCFYIHPSVKSKYYFKVECVFGLDFEGEVVRGKGRWVKIDSFVSSHLDSGEKRYEMSLYKGDS